MGSAVLYTLTGFDCNLSCGYCSQTDNKQLDIIDNGADITDVLSAVSQRLPSPDHIGTVDIRGGEPLLRWERVVAIHLAAKGYFPGAMTAIVTNGKLLTDEMVNFINTQGIHVSISYDGPCSQVTRGYNVLEDKLSLIRRIKQRSFGTVITGFNSDLVKLVDHINSTMNGSRFERIIPRPFAPYSFIETDWAQYDWEVLDSSMAFMCGEFITAHKNKIPYNRYASFARGLFRTWLKSGRFIQNRNAMCYVNYPSSSMINIDYLGNVYWCHNDPTTRLGTVWDTNEFLQQGFLSHTENQVRGYCRSCSAFPLCGGFCPYIHTNAKASRCRCQKLIAKYANVVAEELGLANALELKTLAAT